MSFESPESPHDAMEARLTALLLGELSAEEEATLRAALAKDAALAQLHERLGRTLGLVREAASSLREEAAPPAEALRLSADRREKLLQQFKTIEPMKRIPTTRPTVRWREFAAVAAMLMALLSVAVIYFAPNFIRARSASPAVIAEQARDVAGVKLADASVAMKSGRLVAGTVTPEPPAKSAYTRSPQDVAPVAKYFADVAGTENESILQPSLPVSVPRGGEIALPQLAQTARPAVQAGEALVAFDLVTPADGFKSLSAYSVAPQDKNFETIAGRAAGLGQGFGGGGVGLGGLVASSGGVRSAERFAFGTAQAAANGVATVTVSPSSALGDEFKSDFKAEPQKQSRGDAIDGRGTDSREWRESLVRQQVAAVDTAWMASAPTLLPADPVVVPPPAPPVVVALNPVSRLSDSEDFVTMDWGIAHQPVAKDQLDLYSAEAQKTPALLSALTPAPAAKPAEPTPLPSSETPMTGTFAGTYINGGAAAQTRGNSLASVAARSIGGLFFREPNYGGSRPETTELAIRGRALTSGLRAPNEQSDEQQADKLDTNANRNAPADAKNENLRDESRRFGYVALEKLKAITSAPESAETRSKGFAVVLPQRLAREADAMSEVRSQSGLDAGKPLQLENAVSERKRVDEFAGLQKGPIIEEGRALRRAPEAPVPQPEVSTVDNAFSTFSLNVSDVSFKLAAAALEKGQMPDVATIRSEEFINAFDYRDAEPGGSAPIAFAWERARYPFAHDRDLIRLSVKTAASGRQPGRPLNLVLLIDNSGSMERADRVRIRQECLRVLAGQLQPQDRVSVVSFARTARLWVDGLPGSQAGELPQRVGGLTPEGGTNLEEAMNLAYQTALRHFLANGVNRVVLLTDGAANLGDVQPGSLKKKVEAHRRQGVALDCFGIGWDGLNDELLEALSRNGDGRYGFVNTPEAAASEFAGQLAGALKVAASDVKVQVEWNPRRVTAYRPIGYAKHQLKKEQFRDNAVDAAEIGAAEAGNALYAVQVNPRGEGPLGTVRVRFKVPSSGDYREHEWPLDYDGSAKLLEQSSVALRLAASASAFSEWLVASPFAGEVTPDKLLGYLSGVPESWPADPRPKKLEWMIR